METRTFPRDIEGSLRIEYDSGDVTEMTTGHTTGWRTLPFLLTTQPIGQGTLVQRADRGKYSLKSGDTFCLPAGIHHRIDYLGDIGVSRWSHVNIFILGSIDITALIEIPDFFVGEVAHRIGDIDEELASLHRMDAPELHHIIRRQTLGYQLAETIVAASTINPQTQRLLPYWERLAPVLTYIQENLGQSLSREELANKIHLSPSRFFVLFKEALGISPSDYIQNLRLQQAQRLLMNSLLGIGEIAARCGYPDAFHFSRLFRKRFGISPIQYRKQIRKSVYPG
jgi:AraC-like DNA-binding protein